MMLTILSRVSARESAKLMVWPGGASRLPYLANFGSMSLGRLWPGQSRRRPKPTEPMMLSAHVMVSCSSDVMVLVVPVRSPSGPNHLSSMPLVWLMASANV